MVAVGRLPRVEDLKVGGGGGAGCEDLQVGVTGLGGRMGG